MKTNFENMNWRLALLGDHALVFSLEEKMSEEIIEKIMALKKSIEILHFDFIKELIPSYHTLTLVYDIDLFYQNEIATIHNHSITDIGNDMLTAFNSAATNSTIKNATEKIKANNNLIENNSFTDREKIIRIPVCYDERLGIDLENIVSKNKISIEEIIKIHTEETYLVYCLGFLPGFAYMGKVNAAIQIARHASPRKEVQAGSVGIAGMQTGIYPMNSPGGWQIIGRTPIKIFDKDPAILGKLSAGNRIQFYPIAFSEFEKLNEYK
jgi:inhibitor of KinA